MTKSKRFIHKIQDKEDFLRFIEITKEHINWAQVSFDSKRHYQTIVKYKGGAGNDLLLMREIYDAAVGQLKSVFHTTREYMAA